MEKHKYVSTIVFLSVGVYIEHAIIENTDKKIVKANDKEN